MQQNMISRSSCNPPKHLIARAGLAEALRTTSAWYSEHRRSQIPLRMTLDSILVLGAAVGGRSTRGVSRNVGLSAMLRSVHTCGSPVSVPQIHNAEQWPSRCCVLCRVRRPREPVPRVFGPHKNPRTERRPSEHSHQCRANGLKR